MTTAPISSSPAAGILTATTGGQASAEAGSLFARLLGSAAGIRPSALAAQAGNAVESGAQQAGLGSRSVAGAAGLLVGQEPGQLVARAAAGAAQATEAVVRPVVGLGDDAIAAVTDLADEAKGELGAAGADAVGDAAGELAGDLAAVSDGVSDGVTDVATAPGALAPAPVLVMPEPVPPAPLEQVQQAAIQALDAEAEPDQTDAVDAVAMPGPGRTAATPTPAGREREATATAGETGPPDEDVAEFAAAVEEARPAASPEPAANARPTREARELAAAMAPPPNSLERPAPADQLSVHIARAAAGDERRITIRLDPPELGRVEVVLDTNKDAIRVALSVERPETLDLLRRDAQALDQALARANVRLDGGVEFSLRQQDGGGSQGPAAPARPNEGTDRAGPDGADEAQETRIRTALPGSGGIDIIV